MAGIGDILANPNFQQYLGNAGAQIGGQGSLAAGINPAELIRQGQSQQATEAMLKMIFGQQGGNPQASNAGQALGVPTTNVQPFQAPGNSANDLMSMLKGISPTPKGMPGPDSVNHTVTADGTKTTIAVPSAQNLNTYGTSVPAESQPKQVGSNPSPFYQALLS